MIIDQIDVRCFPLAEPEDDAPVRAYRHRTTDISYDALNRPTSVTWNPAPSQAPVTYNTTSFAFAYDASNRQTSQAVTDNSWWSYPSSSPNSLAYGTNALNQYSAVGSVTPTYDKNGDLTYDGTFTYAYDPEGRLLSVSQGSTNVASYAWDGQGRRKTREVGSTGTVYVTDADNREVLEYDMGTGAVDRWYAYGLGPDAVLSQMNVAAGTRETLVPDVQGSLIGMLDSGTGVLTKTGNQSFGESASLLGTFRFTGHQLDPETGGSTAQPSGLYYYRARMYSPTWGRFLQPDPMSFGGGLNLYAYVQNDPLNLADPLGLCDNPQGCGGSGFDNYLSESAASLAQIPSGVANMATDLATNPSQFFSQAAPTLAGLGLSIPAVGVGGAAAAGTAESEAATAGTTSSEYTLTQTVQNNIATRPYINSPLTIQQITSTGQGVPDLAGAPGALRYNVPGSFNGSQGTYQLVIHPETNMIYHFLFTSGQ